jgi:osmoprotectant transport system substrate-binding protein
VLQDDKHLEAADNVVPIVRTAVATANVKAVLNKIDAALTTADLVNMNSQIAIQHMDPDVVAKNYLTAHNYFS